MPRSIVHTKQISSADFLAAQLKVNKWSSTREIFQIDNPARVKGDVLLSRIDNDIIVQFQNFDRVAQEPIIKKSLTNEYKQA